MKRTFAIALAAVAAAALFAGLVHAVLVAADISQPAAITIYGPTPRRLWASAIVALALIGVLIGGLALYRARVVSVTMDNEGRSWLWYLDRSVRSTACWFWPLPQAVRAPAMELSAEPLPWYRASSLRS